MIGTEMMIDQEPIAIVGGRKLSEIPSDLYIPHDAMKVALDEFEGPLDLLLYLIRKENLDISELAIAPITEQYMNFLTTMNELDVNLAAEYLVMAAVLAQIKSKFILPVLDKDVDEDDPRAELIRRLKVYEQFKIASEQLDEVPRMERDWFDTVVSSTRPVIPLPTASVVDLKNAFLAVTSRLRLAKAHLIGREKFSVSDRMNKVLGFFKLRKIFSFEQLIAEGEGRAGLVVSLVAVLELAKNQMISILQNEGEEKIYFKQRERIGNAK